MEPKLNKYCILNNYSILYQISLLLFVIISSSAALPSCTFLKSIDKKIHLVKQTLEAGEKAFINGNYQLADSLFRQAFNESKNPWDKNRAVYNLACVKLITAEDDSDIIEAMKIFMQWKPSKSIPMYYENPHLIIQALLQKNDLLIKDRESDEFKEFNIISEMHNMQEIDTIVKETNQMNSRLDKLLREQDGKIKTLNSIVKKQNEKIKLLNAIFKKESKAKEDMLTKQKEMQKTIKTLKHQISELERIDQKLQDKRQTE